ncbi:ornithine carbamoyltransferase [Mobilibacterium timonense]|uniref:ornithine carbamoyltransferase n=1 Tax=Mobilibacterium timonense TaxID=1871012 RepID=UPI003A9281AC
MATEKIGIQGKDFLTLLDFNEKQILGLLDLAEELKAKKKAGIPHRMCEGKNIALIFEKHSTRTFSSFNVAANDLGMSATFFDSHGSHIGKKESIADTARVLTRMFDGIEYRGYGQNVVNDLAKYSTVPVWNGLTDEFHPTQILADMLTIKEHFGHLKGIKFVFMGDNSFNMGNSLMIGCARLGLDFTACCPEKYLQNSEILKICKELAEKSGGTITHEPDPYKAVKNADVISTDVWVSMGEPDEIWKERISDLMAYQVTSDLMKATGKDSTVFMHCLPAYHNLDTINGREIYEKFGIDAIEVTDEVFESPQSIVWDEAENRMHTIKAMMAATLLDI